MAPGPSGGDVGASPPDGCHQLQLFSNLLQSRDFREPLERVEYGLFVSHTRRLRFSGAERKRPGVKPEIPLRPGIQPCGAARNPYTAWRPALNRRDIQATVRFRSPQIQLITSCAKANHRSKTPACGSSGTRRARACLQPALRRGLQSTRPFLFHSPSRQIHLFNEHQ